MGIKASTPEQKAQAEKFGIEIIEVENLEKLKRVKFSSPLYISIDLDSLDPAFAPGVSHPEPGGISTRELINIIKGIGAELIGADIVEFNPLKDINSITASLAFKILKELIGNLLSHIYIT
ncbi:MAG: arginase family protein [Candidatus Aminicenantia bacterium]